MAINTLDVADLIITALEADSVLQAAIGGTSLNRRIFQDEAPRDQKGMYVFFGLNSTNEVTFVGNNAVMSKPEYQIRVIGRNTGYTALAPAANRIDVIMKTVGSVVHGSSYIGPFVRGPVIQMSVKYDNETWHNLGRLWRMNAHDV